VGPSRPRDGAPRRRWTNDRASHPRSVPLSADEPLLVRRFRDADHRRMGLRACSRPRGPSLERLVLQPPVSHLWPALHKKSELRLKLIRSDHKTCNKSVVKPIFCAKPLWPEGPHGPVRRRYYRAIKALKAPHPRAPSRCHQELSRYLRQPTCHVPAAGVCRPEGLSRVGMGKIPSGGCRLIDGGNVPNSENGFSIPRMAGERRDHAGRRGMEGSARGGTS